MCQNILFCLILLFLHFDFLVVIKMWIFVHVNSLIHHGIGIYVVMYHLRHITMVSQ